MRENSFDGKAVIFEKKTHFTKFVLFKTETVHSAVDFKMQTHLTRLDKSYSRKIKQRGELTLAMKGQNRF